MILRSNIGGLRQQAARRQKRQGRRRCHDIDNNNYSILLQQQQVAVVSIMILTMLILSAPSMCYGWKMNDDVNQGLSSLTTTTKEVDKLYNHVGGNKRLRPPPLATALLLQRKPNKTNNKNEKIPNDEDPNSKNRIIDDNNNNEVVSYWKELTPPMKTKQELVDEFDSIFDIKIQNQQKLSQIKPPRVTCWYGSMMATSSDDRNSWYPSKHIMDEYKTKIFPYLSVTERIQYIQERQKEQLEELEVEFENDEHNEHVMRMDTYEINVHWKGRREKRYYHHQRQLARGHQRRRRGGGGLFSLLLGRRQRNLRQVAEDINCSKKFSNFMSIEFHPNGYCRSKSIIKQRKDPKRHRLLVTSIGSGGGGRSGGGDNESEGPPHQQTSSSSSSTDHNHNKDDTIVFGIGTWDIYHWGLTFTINHVEGNKIISTYRCFSDLHLNPFGKYPKLTQGIVLREETEDSDDDPLLPSFEEIQDELSTKFFNDVVTGSPSHTATKTSKSTRGRGGRRGGGGGVAASRKFKNHGGEDDEEDEDYFLLDHELEQLMTLWNNKMMMNNSKKKTKRATRNRHHQIQWFRPVVGTFSGIGVGKDTADFSYKDRGFGVKQIN